VNLATSKAHFYEEYVFKDNSITEFLRQAVQYFYSKMHYEPEQGEKKTALHEILYRIDFPDMNTGKGKVMI
jgi:hypothetical protein